jgi:hypothetical protein
MLFKVRLVACLLILVVCFVSIGAHAAQDGVALSADLLVSIVAVAISLCLDVVPGLSERWEELPKEVKRFTWLIGCMVAGVAIWLLGCVAEIQVGVILLCNGAGLLAALRIGFQAYFLSQSVHGLVVSVGKIVKQSGSPPTGGIWCA